LEPDQGGLDLVGLLHTLNIPSVNLRVTDQLEYRSGSLPAERVRSIYRAADVLLNPSMGGACELALLEGQACGLPPISTDWTAMREHNWSGWQIGTAPPRQGGEPFWDTSGGFFFRPSQRAIVQCLVMAHEHRGDAAIRQAAVAGAQAYDVQRVISDHWLPALEQIERLIKGAALFPVPEKVEAVS
jgi:glycosyltransferase involved in cell wall biosynthesis